jgi:hypothetical protein
MKRYIARDKIIEAVKNYGLGGEAALKWIFLNQQ